MERLPRFDKQTAVSAMELHQLIAEWGYDLDIGGGMGVAQLCTEDCNDLGRRPYIV